MTDAIIEAAARALFKSFAHVGNIMETDWKGEAKIILATVTPLIEAAAQAELLEALEHIASTSTSETILQCANDAIAKARRGHERCDEAAALERAAKVADDYYHPGAGSNPYAVQRDIAAAIRALKQGDGD